MIGIVGGFLLLEHSRAAHRPKLDLPGTLVVSAGLFALVFGFSHAETDGWANGVTIGFLVAAAVLLTVFVAIQRRVSQPLLPLRIVLDRNRGGAYLAMFASAAGMFAVFLFLTYYLQKSLGYSAVETGVAFLPLTGVLVVVAAVGSTVLLSRVSSRILIPSGMAISALAMYLLTRIGLDTGYATHVLPPLLLLGAGLGLVFAPGFSLATLGVSATDSGVASATVNTMQQVGGSVGTALLNTIAATAAGTYATAHLGAAHSAGRGRAAQGQRRDPQLHDRLLVGDRDLRPRCRAQRDRAAPRHPADRRRISRQRRSLMRDGRTGGRR